MIKMTIEENNDHLVKELQHLDIESELGIKRLLEISLDKDELVRYEAIGCMINIDNKIIQSRILDALDDSDELVRINALEWIEENKAYGLKKNFMI